MFARQAIAVCPRCFGPALVVCGFQGEYTLSPSRSRVCCLKCSFQNDGRDSSWLGPAKGTAKERCPHCGYKWLELRCVSRSLGSEARQFTGVTCLECGTSTKVRIKWRVERFGKPYDPAFGLPLWSQMPCCGETLWAYNGEHLRALKEYVAAELREDIGLHWSMFGRLPRWMSARKNRGAVLGCIERLEKKLVGVEVLSSSR